MIIIKESIVTNQLLNKITNLIVYKLKHNKTNIIIKK